MFLPDKSQIFVRRKEPTDLEISKETNRVWLRNSTIADAAVFSWVKEGRVGSGPSTAVLKELKKAHDFDSRKQEVTDVLESWNFWRNYYLNANRIELITKAQVTSAERIKKLVSKQNLNLHEFIGCTLFAYRKRNFRPSFQDCLGRGIDYHESYISAVRGDIDRMEYEKSVLA